MAAVRRFIGALALAGALAGGASRLDGEEQHWAFRPPARPPLPAVAFDQWSRQPLDAFILARLEHDGAAPAPQAGRHALLRRVSLVLTGLPPTVEEIDAFLADNSPDAFERVVDRLLASPRYGEHMAVPWLDLARYADTHGYHSDGERVMWPWRDWVIEALNANMPYDRFSLEQLAGDLLPDPTLSQRVATALHRNHMLNDENGAIAEEYLNEYVADRVATTGTIWLGLTLSCARCHDHKYDPISQREYYSLYAFFHNVPENGLGGKTGNAPPTIAAPSRQQQAELAALDARIAILEQRLKERESSCDPDFRQWLDTQTKTSQLKAQPPSDAALHLPLDGAIPAPSDLHGTAQWLPGKLGKALLCDGATCIEVRDAPKWNRHEAFSIAAWVYPTTADDMTIVGRVDESLHRRGFEFALVGGRLVLRLTHASGEDEIEVRSPAPLLQRQWQHVTATYDGSGRAAGAALWVDGQRQHAEVVRDALKGHTVGDQRLTIARGDQQTFFRGMIDDVRLFDRALLPDEVQALAGADPIGDILAIEEKDRTAAQRTTLKRHYLEQVDPHYRTMRKELRPLRDARGALLRAAPNVMVMQELPQPRDTFILERGIYNQAGERVTMGTPAVLPPMDADLPRNRLGLARWLFDPRHPLTSRVAVNRAWQTIFGAGLVRTPDDFGIRGDSPTHPELLDWLAIEYRESGWDTKRLHRQLVTSATFRQSSRVSEDQLALDPDNRRWARGPSFRLSAEVIRDQALSAAGLLDARIGGPSVRPYQPAELWRELAYDPNRYSAQVFVQSTGADLYRRSVYTFWKRTVPPPNLALFDAPDRETCLAERAESHSPLQSLVLLNDTTFVEAARHLAQRVLAGPMHCDAERIDGILLRAIGRPGTLQERRLLENLLAAEREQFRKAPDAASALVEVGESEGLQGLDGTEVAAWTVIASTILNMHESITLP